MRSYLHLLGHRDARWPLITSSFSRLTTGMMALALVLMARQAGYSWAVAGAITAAHQIGIGIGSPVQGRLVDRYGQTVVLVPDAVLYGLGTGLVAWLVTISAPVVWLVAVAALAGMALPPTTSCVRVVLSRLFPTGPLRSTAFAVSAISVEIGFIVGPLIATAIAVRLDARLSVLVAGTSAVIGALGFAATRLSRAMEGRGTAPTSRGGALRSPGVAVMAGALMLTAVVFGIVDVVLPAVAERAGRPETTGTLVAATAAGSLVGGLVYGGRSWPGQLRSRMIVLLLAIVASLLVVSWTLPALTPFRVALFFGGLALGPATIVAFHLIDDLALRGTQTEAMAWAQSAVVVGVAGGAALAGQVLERAAPELALRLGAVSVAMGAVVVIVAARVLREPPPRGHSEVQATATRAPAR